MSSLVLRELVRRDWRERFPSLWAGLGDVIGLGFALSIYWYTGRAFGGDFAARLEGLAPDYFSFVVLGEAVLLLPLALVAGSLRQTREARAEGALEMMCLGRWSAPRVLFALAASSLPRELLRAFLMVAVAAALFGLRVAPAQGLAALGAQLVALPAFLGLGLVAAAVYLRFGRGEGALGFATALAAVLAGTYFPLTVFPVEFRTLAPFLSPFTALLEISRGAGRSGHWAALVGWAAILAPLGAVAAAAAFRSARRSGTLSTR